MAGDNGHEDLRIGVYICHCGSNIAGKVDVEDVAKWAGENLKDVQVSRDYKFMCSDLGQKIIEDGESVNVSRIVRTMEELTQ